MLVANARCSPNVQFLGVVFQDSEEKISSFLQQRGSSYPTVVDERGKTAIAYGVGGVPETFFLDANGVIVAKFSGPMIDRHAAGESQKGASADAPSRCCCLLQLKVPDAAQFVGQPQGTPLDRRRS